MDRMTKQLMDSVDKARVNEILRRSEAHTRWERFIGAFNDIDKYLTRLSGPDSSIDFRGKLREASKTSSVVRAHEKDLAVFANLRNAIVHEFRPGFVVADPHPDVVAKIEKVRDQILKPRTVGQEFSRVVMAFDTSDPIADLLRIMRDQDLSQFPIHSRRSAVSFVGLLTESTIARWVASHMPDGILEDGRTPVGDVLVQGGTGVVEFLSRSAPVTDAVEKFRDFHQLHAILVTDHGRKDETPIGIITAWDLLQQDV